MLLGVSETLPVHWSGDLDELADVELTIRVIQAGAGLINGEASGSLGTKHAGRSEDLEALVAYLETLEIGDSPVPRITPAINSGQRVCDDLGCAICHGAPLFTDHRAHDVGTGDPRTERNRHDRGTAFDTPSLRGLWATAPYLHDGTAPALADVFTTGGSTHNVLDRTSCDGRDDLLAFLFSLPWRPNA